MFGDGVTRDEIRKIYGLNTHYKRKFDGKKYTDETAMDGINIKTESLQINGAAAFSQNEIQKSQNKIQRSHSCPEGWGIFPRAVITALDFISQPEGGFPIDEIETQISNLIT